MYKLRTWYTDASITQLEILILKTLSLQHVLIVLKWSLIEQNVWAVFANHINEIMGFTAGPSPWVEEDYFFLFKTGRSIRQCFETSVAVCQPTANRVWLTQSTTNSLHFTVKKTHCTCLIFSSDPNKSKAINSIGRTVTIILICCFDFFSEHQNRCQRLIGGTSTYSETPCKWLLAQNFVT
jgi:hypothetical protein